MSSLIPMECVCFGMFGKQGRIQGIRTPSDPGGNFTIVSFRAIPLEIAILTGDKRAKELGLMYADRQWEEPREGLDWGERWYDAIPLEERHANWEKGFTPETRLWIDDMYMVDIQSKAVSPSRSPRKSQVMRAEFSILRFSTIMRLGSPVLPLVFTSTNSDGLFHSSKNFSNDIATIYRHGFRVA